MVQWARINSLVRVLIIEGFAMNPTFPVNAFAARRVNIDCKSPSHPARIPSSFNIANARQPVVPVRSIILKQLKVTALSFSSLHTLLIAR